VNPFPLPPSGLPGFEPLLNGTLWQRWADRGKVFPLAELRHAVRYIRLKPSTSCRLAVFADGAEATAEPPLGFLLYFYPNLDRARVHFEKISGRPLFPATSGYEPFLDELGVVAVPFPNDFEVPGLRHFYRGHRLKRVLHEILPDYPESDWKILKRETRRKLLAYKPGRRAVYRVEVRLERKSGPGRVRLPLHVKVESPESYGKGFTRAVAIHAATPRAAAWYVPAPLAAVDERWITATEWIDGNPLEQTAAVGGGVEALRAAGSALAGLHGLDVDLECCSDALAGVALGELAQDLAGLLPDEMERVLHLGDRLVQCTEFLATPPGATVHGDFHLGQVLQGGDRTVLVDLDRAGSGHSLSDIGMFLAHLEELGLGSEAAAAFLKGYAATGRDLPGPGPVAAVTAAALFRRCVFPFRRLAPDWPGQMEARLARIEHLLEESRR
jgi:aminoglycoside phosphotransferase (APT) family kinase protein